MSKRFETKVQPASYAPKVNFASEANDFSGTDHMMR